MFKKIIPVISIGILLALTIQAQTATHPAPLDFDGDGKTDLAIARNDISVESGPLFWWIRSSGNQQTLPVVRFGGFNFPRQRPIPADYDGDGKTDIAVFQIGMQRGIPTFFHVLRSSDGVVDWIQWGLDSDNPYLTQDFDGDGKADPTVVRCRIPRPGGKPPIRLERLTWYILESSSDYQSFRVETFGKCDGSRDRPIRGDFDGDGKADLAFYRELDVLKNGETRRADRFYIRLSGRRNFVRRVNFDFVEGGLIFQGDFDGDGRTDLAKVRSEASGGELRHWRWYWIRSSDGVLVSKQFGVNSPDFAQRDTPVPGDYDGDGKWDTAVWRVLELGPDQGFFYINGSRDGFRVIPWGLELVDLPISQAVYLR